MLAFGLLLAIAAGEAVLRAPLVLLFSAPIIAISVLVGLFSPFRLIKQRSDAKRINAWQPESIEGLSISSEIDGTISEELLLENILIPVPLKTEVALACFVGFPITALGVLLAILFTGGGSGALLSGAPRRHDSFRDMVSVKKDEAALRRDSDQCVEGRGIIGTQVSTVFNSIKPKTLFGII